MLRMMYTPQLLNFLPGEFGAVMRARWERGFALHPNAMNPYARLLLLGESGDDPARTAVKKVEFVLSDAATYLEGCAARSFDGIALSNILDGATAVYRLRLEAAVRRAASDEAVVVLRSFAEPASEAAAQGAARERSMLWGSLDVRPAPPMPHVYNNYRMAVAKFHKDSDGPDTLLVLSDTGGMISLTAYDLSLIHILSGSRRRSGTRS